jgi:HAD superfamily hydrolase (TIGR01490 family)
MALAIFDLDETLIHGDCSSLWSAQMVKLGWVEAEAFLNQDAALMRLYAEGKLAMEEYMNFSLAPLVARSKAEVAQQVTAYVEEVIAPIVHKDACRCLATHREAGDRLLIISASAHFLVSAIARHLRIADVLAIDLHLQNDHYSGKTEGVLTYREGKVIRLQAWLQEHAQNLDGAYFYSDSHNDLPLLQRVDNPRAVNPDPLLRQHAQREGWPILEWH